MIATILWTLLTLICKWLPHTANYSPEIAMTVYLASRYSFLKAGLLTLAVVEIADIGLSVLHGYPVFGLWSVVNAITLLLIIALFANSSSKMRWFNCIAKVFCASLFFWLLTNLGVWLSTEYYPMNVQGLILCYDMALPFLPAQLLSGVVFGALWAMAGYVSLNSKIVHSIAHSAT
jgi:hypothetical protein